MVTKHLGKAIQAAGAEKKSGSFLFYLFVIGAVIIVVLFGAMIATVFLSSNTSPLPVDPSLVESGSKLAQAAAEGVVGNGS